MAAPDRPFVIAHRGASGYLPEHTLAGYFVAIQQGTDYVEPDLVITRDGALVVRHENEIGSTTDVASHPEFAARRTTRTVDGQSLTGWFTEDFTLAELKTLRARERLPELRRANTRYDGVFQVPTFEEVLQLVAAADAQRAAQARAAGRAPPPRIGIYPETKHPSYFAQAGTSLRRPAAGRVEPPRLQPPRGSHLHPVVRSRQSQGAAQAHRSHAGAARGAPRSALRFHAGRRSAQLSRPDERAGLEEIATYADAIGPHKWMVVQFANGQAQDTGLARRARAAGLGVHVWTLRAENEFLPPDLSPSVTRPPLGDLRREIDALLDAGISGFFSDQPDLAVRARDEWWSRR
jgi:glycerophosphoryl diester phosphodiesterase